jgi:hypothetical protein
MMVNTFIIFDQSANRFQVYIYKMVGAGQNLLFDCFLHFSKQLKMQSKNSLMKMVPVKHDRRYKVR